MNKYILSDDDPIEFKLLIRKLPLLFTELFRNFSFIYKLKTSDSKHPHTKLIFSYNISQQSTKLSALFLEPVSTYFPQYQFQLNSPI